MKELKKTLAFIEQQKKKADNTHFFENLVLFLSDLFKKDHVLIDFVGKGDFTIATTAAICSYGNLIPNFNYKLKNSPCENVIGKKACVYKKQVRQLFPKDLHLVKMNVESYVGYPLSDSLGVPLGLIAVLDSKQMNDTKCIELILQLVAISTSHEIEKLINKKREKELKTLNYSIINTSKDVLFRTNFKGEITFISPSVKNITGYTIEEVLGVNLAKKIFKYPAYKKILFNKILKKGGVDNFENLLIKKDKSHIWTSLSAQIIKNDQDN